MSGDVLCLNTHTTTDVNEKSPVQQAKNMILAEIIQGRQ